MVQQGVDLIEDCISDIVNPGQKRDYKAFQDTFCLRCRNANCIHAKWIKDKFGARVALQPDRLFNPTMADGKLPQYADLVDFTDKFQEAMRLDIANRRGDWEVPEVPIIDGQVEQGAPSTTDVVDNAVRALAKSKGQKEPKLPDPTQASMDTFLEETKGLMADEDSRCDEQPPQESAPVVSAPEAPYPLGNTPVPQTGVMVGGGSPPPVPQEDDWTPKPKERKIVPGATIKMGGTEPPESE